MMTVEQLLVSSTDYSQRTKKVQSKFPFYHWCCQNVPGYKTRRGNLLFRKKVLKLALEDEDFALQLWIMCSRDILFFVNTFVFTYDPRLVPKIAEIPFITYDFQDVAFHDIIAAIDNKYDQLTEKSRTMGASWMYLIVFLWMFLFVPYAAFRLLSRNEDLVDKDEDPDSLFWKVLFALNHLPKFLQPETNYVHLHMKNYDNEATIDGCTTTSDTARGGRCTALFPDEFAAVPDGAGMLASTRDVTKCRLFNSTHHGAGTAFYRLSQSRINKLTLHWSLHPLYNKGLYYSENKKLIRCDKDFKSEVWIGDITYNFPDNYPFILDGKLRSPWYDNECARADHPMEIAQELDIDPFAADFQYFNGPMIQDIENEDVRPP